MSRDVIENVLHDGMTEADVCRVLGPDGQNRCAGKNSRVPIDSHWRIGDQRVLLAPWIVDEQSLTVIYGPDRRVVRWILVHPLPSVWTPMRWYLPSTLSVPGR